MRGTVVAAVAMALACGSAAAAGKRSLLLLEPQFDSSAADGQTAAMEAADRARIAAAGARLDAMLRASDAYAPVDAPAVAGEIANYTIGSCGRCELMLGRKAGAELVMVTSVQKLSSMLINVSAAIYAVEDGAAVAAGTTVINADTDEDWRRAIDKLAIRRLGLSAP